MESTFVEASGEIGKGEQQQHHRFRQHHQLLQGASPRTLRRSRSANSSAGGGKAATPKCVCAPATHAGSFKCRLHRVNSQGRSTSSPLTPLTHQPPAAATPASPTAELPETV